MRRRQFMKAVFALPFAGMVASVPFKPKVEMPELPEFFGPLERTNLKLAQVEANPLTVVQDKKFWYIDKSYEIEAYEPKYAIKVVAHD